ncbi:MAG: DUF952 domain-containing protein [Acidimicrobiia bacterium]
MPEGTGPGGTGEGDVVVHVTTPEAWAEARDRGEVVPPSLATEGFVHCSTPAQVAATIARHLGGVPDLLLLHVAVAGIADLRWEAPPDRPDERYPHVYGPIPLDAVVAAERWAGPA